MEPTGGLTGFDSSSLSPDLVFELNLLDRECKTSDLVGMLYLISREAVGGEEIDRYWRQKEATTVSSLVSCFSRHDYSVLCAESFAA